MILAAALAMQLASAPTLIVRTATGADSARLDTRGGLAVVDAGFLRRAGITARATGEGRLRLAVGTATFDLIEGVPFVRIRDSVVLPLVAAPMMVTGAMRLPLQMVSEMLPRYGVNLRYDAAARQLTVFEPTVFSRGAGSTAPVVREPSVAAPPPSPARTTAAAPRPAAARGHKRIVVVDAGHGGPDNGMTGPMIGRTRFHEKDVVLAVSRRLRDALVARGMEVVMTRTTDTLIALADRGRIANDRHADLFVSIHVNAANPRWKNPTEARGIETYFLAEAKTEDARRVAEMENEAVRFETDASASRDDPLSFIINDMATNEHLRESSDLAERVQRALAKSHPGPSRGVKQAGFRVLVSAFMPAILIEIGFGTNPDEAAWMASLQGQRAIALAVADAVTDYLAHYEARVGPQR